MECRITDEVVKNPWERKDMPDQEIAILERKMRIIEKSIADLKQSSYNFEGSLIALKKEINHSNLVITFLGIALTIQALVLIFR